jgi:micrococcal nuclease
MRIALIALALAGCGGGANTVRVERVVDGDTIVVRLDGRSEKLRYIGVDTPESVKPGVRVQCYAKSAAAENRRLVLGRSVRLEYDAEPRDRYGRLLAYVWRGEVLVNAELVRRGYGKPLEIAPNLAHAAELRRLASAARRAHRGLWSRC